MAYLQLEKKERKKSFINNEDKLNMLPAGNVAWLSEKFIQALITIQDDNVSSSGMEPDQPAVVAMLHGVISPEMVEDLYSDNVPKQLESTQKFRYCHVQIRIVPEIRPCLYPVSGFICQISGWIMRTLKKQTYFKSFLSCIK